MSKVRMLLELDFNKLQCAKSEILNLALGFSEEEGKIIYYIVDLIEKIQEQSIDNPWNEYSNKQVYGV